MPKPTTYQIRELLARLNLGQRQAARVLQQRGHAITEDYIRHCCTGRQVMDTVIYRDLLQMESDQ